MMINRLLHLTLALFTWLLAQSGDLRAAAGDASIVRGISIELSWTDSRVERFLDTGEEKPGYQVSAVRLYISEQGRFFSKFSRTARGRGNSLDRQGVSGEGPHVLNWHFQGRTVVGDQKFNGSGARRVVVSFGDSYSSCAVQVVHGKEGNKSIRYPGLTSLRPIELIRIEVTSTSCQVRKGNIFE
jgi:hypothetical protein